MEVIQLHVYIKVSFKHFIENELKTILYNMIAAKKKTQECFGYRFEIH